MNIPPFGSFVDAVQFVLGVKISTMIAGFLGTLTKVFLSDGNWKESCIIVFIGLATVNYLVTPMVQSQWNVLNIPEGTMGYLIGLTAVNLSRGAINLAKIWGSNPILPK